MSLGVALDVSIGLMFIYLLLGMLASTVQEFVAGFFKLRGRQLRDALASMLSGVGAHGQPVDDLFESVFHHPLVQNQSASKLPTYVSGQNFALALIDALGDGSQSPLFSQIEKMVADLPDGNAKNSLSVLVKRTGGDLDKLQASIHSWFDDTMDRISGQYKRFTQRFTFAFGLLIAVGLNINSVDLANYLWNTPASRNALITMAEERVKEPGGGTAANDATTKEVLALLNKMQTDLVIPIGWPSQQSVFVSIKKKFATQTSWTGWAAIIVGWLITALAVSLGAPFWFDMLQNVVNLRNAGPKPQTLVQSQQAAAPAAGGK